MLGPIDYIVVGFTGNNFDGSIMKELQMAADKGVIRVVDLLFVIKNEKGEVNVAEVMDQSDEIKELAKSIGMDPDLPLLTEEDTQKLGAKMDNNTAAGILVIEQLWAKGLKKALLDAGGQLIDEGRVHPDQVQAAVDELQTVKE